MQPHFELPYEKIESNIEYYIDEVFSTLKSSFMTLPKGEGFIECAAFEDGYELLKKTARSFTALNEESMAELIFQYPITFIVLRSILGFTPSEWAEAATTQQGMEITQGFARNLDRKIRLDPEMSLNSTGASADRLRALIKSACQLLIEGPDIDDAKFIHRLNKVDTASGIGGIETLAGMGVPYPMLLYERFLGRPFASHRDSVSEFVGDILENAIEELLSNYGISVRKTKRAERIEGFDQVPDFFVPSEFNPKVVIEAKLAEDDGTARDKVTRVQHLHAMSMRERTPEEGPRYQVIACIAGRGFRQRRQDMKKLLEATHGKVFTLQTIPYMVEHTKLKEFVTKPR